MGEKWLTFNSGISITQAHSTTSAPARSVINKESEVNSRMCV